MRKDCRLLFKAMMLCLIVCAIAIQLASPVAAAITSNCTLAKTGSVSADGDGVYSLQTYLASATGTVTITNNTSDTRIYVIDYSVTISDNDCYIQTSSKKHTASATGQSYTVTLEGGAVETITIYCDKAWGSRSASITFTNISDSKVVTADVKFASYDDDFATSSVGSYTISGVTASDYIDQDTAFPNYTSTDGVTVTATTVSGYDFIGWVNIETNEVLSEEMTATLRPEVDCTIAPVYISSTSTQGLYLADSILYPSWETAFAGAGSSTVLLLRNCTLPAGTYTIGSGQKLLIPYDAKRTEQFDDSPNIVSVATPTVYRTLTLADGAVIQCNGSINVGGQVSAESSSYAGRPTGAYGRINMLGENSKLILASADSTNSTAGTLYCYGFIIGSGEVVAQSGASVYETFDACGFRGGTTTSGAWLSSAGLEKTYKSFLFSEYSVHNIELDFALESGASWYTVASIAPSTGDTIQASAQFAGTSSGMFQMGTNATVLRSYDPNTDRTTFTLNGTVNLTGFVLSMGGTSLDTSQFILGINGGWDVVIESGTLTVGSPVKLMPGTTLTIEENGKMLVNDKMYLYDAVDYAGKGYVYYRCKDGSYAFPYVEAYNCMPTQYIATTNKSYSHMSDSFARTIGADDHTKVVVNGTLEVGSNGGVYTTSNGGQSAGKVLLGEGTFINNSTTATGIVTDYLDELTWYYESWYSYGLTDNNITVTPAVGLIKGLSTSASDYRCFEAGKTYHGSSDGYWYEYTVSTVVDGGAAEVVGYVGNGSSITFNDSGVASSLTAVNGSYTFDVGDYIVETSNGVLSNNGNGNYTLSDVTADTTLTFTTPCKHETANATAEVTATCATDGTKAYYYCSGCETYFSDADYTAVIEDFEAWKTGDGKIEALGHSETDSDNDHICDRDGCTVAISTCKENATATAAKTATCQEAGNIAYWTCGVCGNKYSDADCTTEVTDVTIAIDSPAHAWDNACDTTCNNGCGTTRTVTHSYGDWVVTTAPGCETEGEETKTCSVCGDKQTQKVEATGHNMQVTSTQAPTCAEAGSTTSKCQNEGCGHTETTAGDAALGCDYKGVVTAPTCTEKGYTTYTCSTCGANYVDNYTDALGHQPGAAATCATAQVCTRDGCGVTLAEATGKHVYNVEVEGTRTPATCKAAGSVTMKCETCTATEVQTLDIDSSNHVEIKQVAAQAPTCSAVGWNAYECCTGCTYTTYNELAKVACTDSDTDKDHLCDYDCGKALSECSGGTATCTEQAVCTTCGEKYGELAAHSYTTKASASVKTEANCHTFAVYYVQCDNCTAVSDTDTVDGTEYDADNHDGGTETVAEVSATCQAAGTTAGVKCLGCVEIISGCTVIEKLTCADTDNDHYCNNGCSAKLSECSFTVKGDLKTAATCVTKAVYEAKCSICGEVSDTVTIEGDVDSDAHSLKTVAAQTATCTQIGWAEYVCCQREGCGYSTYNPTEKLDHDYSDEYLSDANGHWHKCENCNATTDVVSHTEETIPGYAATCTSSGKTDGTNCSICEYVIKEQEEIPQASHNYGEPQFTWNGYECTAKVVCDCTAELSVDVTVTSEITTIATCKVVGVKTYTATAEYGEETYTDTRTENLGVNAENHKMTAGTVVAPTCVADGYTVYTCGYGCGKTENRDTVAKLGHNYKVTSVDFSTDGTTYTVTVTCSECEVGTDGHTKISGDMTSTKGETTDGDCKTNSTTVYSASGEYEGVSYSEAKTVEGSKGNHSYEAVVSKPTCTVDGYTTHTCSICGDSYTDSTVTASGHAKYTNGFCDSCDAYEPAVRNSESVYEISNAGQLYWFAEKVNNGETDIDGVLKNDIVINQNVLTNGELNDGDFREWTPIGGCHAKTNYEQVEYVGTFNGGNHSISGLYFNDTEAYEVGLFGFIDSDAAVLNVCVNDSYINACSEVGGIVGWLQGIVEGCEYHGVVIGGQSVGGISAVCEGGYGQIVNCASFGTISGNQSVGGIVGILSECTVKNCYNVASVKSNNSAGAIASDFISGTTAVTNCYYLAVSETDSIDGTTAMTADQFASGEVAYLLNGDQSKIIWYQTCGEGYPAFSGNQVYKNQTGGCTNESYTYEYANEQADAVVTHVEGAEADCENAQICTVCEEVLVPATGHTGIKVDGQAATCGADGWNDYYDCEDCDKYFSDADCKTEITNLATWKLGDGKIEATGAHVYATETERVAATCLEDGYVIMACGCGATEKTVLSAPGHIKDTPTVENEKAAGCETAGSYDSVVKCTICTAELSCETITVDATGHKYGDWTETTAPTCTTVGEETRVCENDENHKETREVAALTHDWTAVEYVWVGTDDSVAMFASEESEVSCTATRSCDRDACDVVETETAVLTVSGSKDADCENTGYINYTASFSNDWAKPAEGEEITSSKSIPAIGHIYGTEWKYDETDHWHVCACGDQADVAVHDFDDGVETKAPTVEEMGVMTYSCECGYSYTEDIPKLEITYIVANYTGNANAYSINGTVMNVQNTLACVVLVEHSEDSYTRLEADENSEAGYDFDLSGVKSGETIVIAVKGDLNQDGELMPEEVTQIRATQLGKLKTFTELQKMVSDVNGDGSIMPEEVTQIRAAQLGKFALNW